MLSPTEQIKERLSIIEVVSSYVKLQKAGKNYKGNSPFSNEKTPSFFVSPERDMYYCFSTNQGGDIFTFIEKVEGVDFSGALKILADRAGVALRQESKEIRDKRERLYDALEAAVLYYESQLQKYPEIIEYLAYRGISPKTINHFRIGYALPNWRALYDNLSKKGFTEQELKDVGLIKSPEQTAGEEEKRSYDRFRGRIMFPIADSAGRIVAFSGRIVVDDGKSAKYINSPETNLYNKSKILYGYDRAKGGIKKFDFSILVEGQMDVVMSHQAGYSNTVGISGTALTQDQLTLLHRLSKNVVMAFDADRAGVASVGKGAELALAMGMDVKVVHLPEGQDPADVIKENPSLWKNAVREAVHIVEFYITLFRKYTKDKRAFKLRVQEVVIPFIARIKNAIDQNHFIHIVAEALNVSENLIIDEVSKIPQELTQHAYTTDAGGTLATQTIASEPNDSVAQRVARIILWQKTLPKPHIIVDEVLEKFETILGKDRVSEFLEMPKEREREEIFKTELLYEDDTGIEEDVATLLMTLEYRMVKQEFEEVMQALRTAEREGSTDEVTRLLIRSKEITETLKTYIGKV